jgi:D-alanyl-D-alanine carboxypeptidase
MTGRRRQVISRPTTGPVAIFTMATMTITTSTVSRTRRHRVAKGAATLAAIGVLLTATACSSDRDGNTASDTMPAASEAPSTARELRPPTTPERAPPMSLNPPVPISAPPTTAAPTTAPSPTTAAPTNAVAADPARQAQLGDILDVHHTAGEFVGARIALRDADGTISEATAGTPTTDPASGPIDPTVRWNIGSATKAFVAVVVLQLAEEGRVDLDAGIDGYLPDLPAADRITPRQLLNHTSGLNEYLDQPLVVNDPLHQWTPAELIAVAEAAGRVGEPGGPHRYSNTNYVVLGEIIEQVTGNPWADEVHARIAEPLGMTRTGLIADTAAPGHDMINGSFVDVTSSFDPSVGGAAGGLQSTSRDLLAFAGALADGTLLSPESQAAMQTFLPAEDLSQFGIDHGYGLGLERYAMDGMTVIGHMGTGKTGSSYVGYDAAHGTAVAVTTNTAIEGPAALIAVEVLTAASQTG